MNPIEYYISHRTALLCNPDDGYVTTFPSTSVRVQRPLGVNKAPYRKERKGRKDIVATLCVLCALNAHIVSRGRGEGEALVTSQPISFLGSIDPKTGVVVERGHELEGKSIKGKVLIFPGGKGSTVGSYVIYQLKKNGAAPCAMVNIRAEPIVAVGAIISDIPLVDRVEKVATIKTGDKVLVDAIAGSVEIL